MVVWQNEAALNAFVGGKVHASAMTTSLTAVQNARFVGFGVARADVALSWQLAEKKMQQNGRLLY